jgi:hypothetical protein
MQLQQRPAPPPPKHISTWFLTREWAKKGSPWTSIPEELCLGLKLHRSDTGANPIACQHGMSPEKEAEIRKSGMFSMRSLGLYDTQQLVFVVPVLATYPKDLGDNFSPSTENESLWQFMRRKLTPSKKTSTADGKSRKEFVPAPPAHKKILFSMSLFEQCLRFWTPDMIAAFTDPTGEGVRLPEDEFMEWIDTTDARDERLVHLDYIMGYLVMAFAALAGNPVPVSIVGIHDMGLDATLQPWPRGLLELEIHADSRPRVLRVPWSADVLERLPALKHQVVNMLYPWPGTWTQQQWDESDQKTGKKEINQTKEAQKRWRLPFRNELSYRVDKKQLVRLRYDPRAFNRLVVHNQFALRRVMTQPSRLAARANVERALGTLVPDEVKDYVIEQYETEVGGCTLCERHVTRNSARYKLRERQQALLDEYYGTSSASTSNVQGCATCKWALPGAERAEELQRLHKRREFLEQNGFKSTATTA